MKAPVCKVCGFVAIDGTAPEKCPVCGAPKTAFVEKEDAIKAPGASTYGESEKKHIPEIHIVRKCGLFGEGCIDVLAKVGEIPHPMLPEHFIGRLDFYLDKRFIARVQLTPEKLNAASAVHLKVDSGTITVVENCNVHGSWMSEAKL